MSEIANLIDRFGVGISVTIVFVMSSVTLLKWVLGKLNSEIQEIHEIVVKLIDRIRKMDEHILQIGGKIGINRKDD